jgi:hypothetical protein
MQQLEIPFFYPLIEQTTLDLDFTSSEQWIAEWRQKQWSTSVTAINGSYPISSGGTGSTVSTWSTSPIATSFVIRPDVKNAGKWEITDSVFVYLRTKPNAVVRFFAKYLLGFKWHDEN